VFCAGADIEGNSSWRIDFDIFRTCWGADDDENNQTSPRPIRNTDAMRRGLQRDDILTLLLRLPFELFFPKLS